MADETIPPAPKKIGRPRKNKTWTPSPLEQARIDAKRAARKARKETSARPDTWRPKVGKPLALTQEIGERILSSIRIGSPVELAVKATGIHRDTFYGWMQRARKGEEPFASFADAVEEAKGAGELRLLLDIHRAGSGQPASSDGMTPAVPANWFARAWQLERLNPSQWAKPERDAVTVNVGVSLEQVLPERYQASLKNEDNLRQLTEGEIVADEPPPEGDGSPGNAATH